MTWPSHHKCVCVCVNSHMEVSFLTQLFTSWLKDGRYLPSPYDQFVVLRHADDICHPPGFPSGALILKGWRVKQTNACLVSDQTVSVVSSHPCP